MAGTDFRKREPVVATAQAEANRRLDRLCIDTIRTLAMDAVQKAKSGHPGTPMALAPVADRQDEAYRQSVLPHAVKARVSVEAASTCGWERYVGIGGAMVGMHSFGASAPLKDVMKAFGFTAEHVVAAAKAQIAKWKKS